MSLPVNPYTEVLYHCQPCPIKLLLPALHHWTIVTMVSWQYLLSLTCCCFWVIRFCITLFNIINLLVTHILFRVRFRVGILEVWARGSPLYISSWMWLTKLYKMQKKKKYIWIKGLFDHFANVEIFHWRWMFQVHLQHKQWLSRCQSL